ncbi:hypothetical protein LP418_24015 [Nocardioides sp. B-3]|nr:hypothetical protein LP418_24015 [Nocardioides sp. B-3]
MTRLGIPVPPGFHHHDSCLSALPCSGRPPSELSGQINDQLRLLEHAAGRRLGDSIDPLLVSVRSGSVFSMPGMMDTVLNIGLNDLSVRGLAEQSGRPASRGTPIDVSSRCSAAPCSTLPLNSSKLPLRAPRPDKGFPNDSELDAGSLKELVNEYKTPGRRDW